MCMCVLGPKPSLRQLCSVGVRGHNAPSQEYNAMFTLFTCKTTGLGDQLGFLPSPWPPSVMASSTASTSKARVGSMRAWMGETGGPFLAKTGWREQVSNEEQLWWVSPLACDAWAEPLLRKCSPIPSKRGGVAREWKHWAN